MKPGIVLAFSVAVEVMGWTPRYVPDDSYRVDARGLLDYWITPEGHHRPCGWDPSTDIASAWEVLGKLRADGFGVAHQGPFPSEFGGDQWWEFRHDDGRGGQAYEDEDAQAISLAALQRELDAKACRGPYPLLSHKPKPAYLGFHGVHPQYEGQEVCQEACEHFGGRPCYDSNSASAADGMFEVLLREGSEGVWKALEERYREEMGVDVESEADHP